MLMRWGASLMVVIASFLLSYFLDRDKIIPLMTYILCLLGGLAIFLSYPSLYRYGIVSRTKKLLSEGNNAAILGPQVMQLSESGLDIETATSSGQVRWSAVDRFVQNDDYLFLYIGATNALVIPKRAFSDKLSEHQAIEEISKYVQATSIAR